MGVSVASKDAGVGEGRGPRRPEQACTVQVLAAAAAAAAAAGGRCRQCNYDIKYDLHVSGQRHNAEPGLVSIRYRHSTVRVDSARAVAVGVGVSAPARRFELRPLMAKAEC